MVMFTKVEGNDPGPGEYVVVDGKRKRTAKVGCTNPDCGGVISLSRHMIGSGGQVNPDVRCPFYGCGKVVHATLVEWSDKT